MNHTRQIINGMAKDIIKNDRPDEPPTGLEMFSHGRELFQNGVILILAGRIKEGGDFLKRFRLFFSRLSDWTEPRRRDWVRYYCARLLCQVPMGVYPLYEAKKMVKKELQRYTRLHYHRDLIEPLYGLRFLETVDLDEISTMDHHTVTEPELFKVIGGLLLEAARIEMLHREFSRALRTAKTALFLFKNSLFLINSVLSRRLDYKEIEPGRMPSIEDLLNTFPMTTDKVKEERECLIGNLDYYIDQANLLKNLADSRTDRINQLPKEVRREFERFTAENVFNWTECPGDLDFLEEVEWAVLKMIFNETAFENREASSAAFAANVWNKGKDK